MLVLTEEDVRSRLDLARLVDALASAHAALSQGRAINPGRFRTPGGNGALASMPAYLPGVGLGIKALTSFRGNRERGLPNTQAVVLVFSEDDGRPLAAIAATHLTAARTAAAGALSTRLLARSDVHTLAVFGAGFQAPYHVLCNLAVRPFERVVLSDRTRASVERLRATLQKSIDVPIEIASNNEEAARAADVIVCTTDSDDPVVLDDWIRVGTHVVSVASPRLTTQELDPHLIARSQFYVDWRGATDELGDYLQPLAAGLINEAHIVGDLGELVCGTAPGRANDQEVTVYKSAGLAIQDLAAAGCLLRYGS